MVTRQGEILILEEGRVPAKNARGCKIEGQKKRVTKEECKTVAHRQQENAGRQRSRTQRRGRLDEIILSLAQRKLSQQLVEGG